MEKYNLIYTFSGIRGIAKKDFNFSISKKIGVAFGLFLDGKDKRVIIGRDTRPSGELIEKGVIEGLLSVGSEITSVGICPSPVIIHAKNNLKIPAGIIITGSHNPQEWNGLKLLSTNNFLGNVEIEQINQNINKISLQDHNSKNINISHKITKINPIPHYIKQLFKKC